MADRLNLQAKCVTRGGFWLASAALIGIASRSSMAAVDYSWNSAGASWSSNAAWSPNSGSPGAIDNIVSPTQTGNLTVDGTHSVNNVTDSNSTAGWTWLSTGSTSVVTIGGTLTVNSNAMLSMRGSTGLMPVTISNNAGATNAITISGSTTKLSLGVGSSSGRELKSLTVSSGLVDVQGGTFTVNADTATLSGGLHMSESVATTFNYNQRNFTTNIAFLSGGISTSKVAMDSTIFAGDTGTDPFNATLNINGSNSFSAQSFAGIIADSAVSTRITSLQKMGSLVQTLSGTSTFTGGTSITGGTLRADNNAALGTGSVSIGGGTLDVLATRTLSNNISLTSGTLAVNGTIQTGTLSVTGGMISGSGTISQALTVATGATLSPGTTSGILHTGTLNLQSGSTYSADLSGTTAGAGYDQAFVTGGVTLGNGTLTLTNIASGLTTGTFFDIIKNGSTVTLASGLGFNGLADGSQFSSGGYTFRIDYDGTSTGLLTGGHDVLLTVVPEPALAGIGFLALTLLGRRRNRK